MDAEGRHIPVTDFKRLHDVLDERRKWKQRTPMNRCLWWQSECTQPIGSHSLSKSWLKTIAKDGKVIQLHLNPHDAGKKPVGIFPRLEGINKASVFQGFCSSHDDEIFKSIDHLDVLIDAKTCSLISYRSLCQNACAKVSNCGAIMKSFDLFRTDSPTAQDLLTVSEMKMAMDHLALKYEYEKWLDDNSIESPVHHHVITFDGKLPFIGSATFQPYITTNGKLLRRNSHLMSFTILPQVNGGVAVFSWEKKNPENGIAVVKSLKSVSNDMILDFLLYFLLDHAENFAIAPDWWDSLDEYHKLDLRRRMARGIGSSCSQRPLYKTFRLSSYPCLPCSNVRRFQI